MPTLESLIKCRIKASGPITFRDFMDMALYHPQLGYYCRAGERVGADGDFYTSPATHPVFGALLALQLEQMWQVLGRPLRFQVLEAGAGKGLLARDILDYLPHLSPSFARSVKYVALEKQTSISVPTPTASGDGSGPAVSSDEVVGCCLSNELVDAFPVHRVIMHHRHLREIYVGLKDDSFYEFVGELSTPRLEQYLATEDVCLVEGQRAEINFDAIGWIHDTGLRLQKGFLVTIDYGYLAAELFSGERRQGTLMTYRRHIAGDNPYVNIGEQDLTTHVDFSALISAGFEVGLETCGLLFQGEFLRNLGFNIFMRALRRERLPGRKYTANRFAMQELVRPEGFGNFKVLVQSKGVERSNLYGLNEDDELVKRLRELEDKLPVPPLRDDHIPLLEAKYPECAADL